MERTTILLTKIILNMEDDSMISGIKRGGDLIINYIRRRLWNQN